MSLIINIPDLDDSASLLPVLNEAVAGFPVASLYGLYLFEDGVVGSVPTSALDSSPNAHNATLYANSNLTRIAEGLKTGDAANRGFNFNSGLPAGADFSIVWVERNRMPAGSTAGTFPTLVHATGNDSAADSNGSIASANTSTRGVLAINHDSGSATTTPEVGLVNLSTGGVKWTNPPSSRSRLDGTGAKASWIAGGLSVNYATNTVILRAMGQTLTFSGAPELAIWGAAGVGTLVFGQGGYATTGQCLGDYGLAALYSVAKSVADLDTLIAAAKARMVLRGVTAL